MKCSNISLYWPTGHSQWRVLDLTVQHEPIVFFQRSASRENCEQNPSTWPSLCKPPTCSPDRNYYSTSVMTGRSLWWEEVENVRGGGEGARSWKSFCSLCEGRWSRLISGYSCPTSASSPDFLSSAPSSSPPSFPMDWDPFHPWGRTWRWKSDGWAAGHCSGFRTLRLAFAWFRSSQFSVAALSRRPHHSTKIQFLGLSDQRSCLSLIRNLNRTSGLWAQWSDSLKSHFPMRPACSMSNKQHCCCIDGLVIWGQNISQSRQSLIFKG